jgi:hypothetical protein
MEQKGRMMIRIYGFQEVRTIDFGVFLSFVAHGDGQAEMRRSV